MKNKLFILMGYPGCGKSRLSKTLVTRETDLYLSSDELREEMFGFRDQTHNKELFAELYRRAIEHSSIGDTYIDATSLTRKDRLRTVNQFNKIYELHLICVLRSIDELVEVNEYRKINSPTEYIPDDVFKTILGRFQLPTYDEGWDDIQYYFVTTKFSPLDGYFSHRDRIDIPHDNPHHPESIKEHINYLIGCCFYLQKRDIIRKLAEYHDNGKFYVKTYNPDKDYCQFLGHAAVSAYIYLINTAVNYMYINHIIAGFIDNFNKDVINTSSFIDEYYGIFYHDLPYTLPNRDDLTHSLSKPSKPISYMYKKVHINDGGDRLADILLEFNEIDRMRAGDNNDE